MNDGTIFPAAPWNPPRPLTRARVDSGKLYEREPSVMRQIAHFCALPDRVRCSALCAPVALGDVNRPKEETLVYFVREYDRRGQQTAAWDLLEALVSRLSGHIKRELSKWRLPQAEQDECAEALITQLYERVLSHEPSEEFWEVRFWVCLDRRLHALAEKLQRVRDRELRPADDFGDDSTDTTHGSEGVFARLADSDASPETMVLRKELLSRLSGLEAQSVFLKYIERMPEESGDADRVTIATVLGVTGRTVRNYLRRAEKKLLAPDA
ncbi:MAG: sigma-70 family RNA polymerase sigma factor [Armatimonadetes bacterium]|nr:sigma-70 family RNA polymerase sigma factor [Armatimonadota bacterium]